MQKWINLFSVEYRIQAKAVALQEKKMEISFISRIKIVI